MLRYLLFVSMFLAAGTAGAQAVPSLPCAAINGAACVSMQPATLAGTGAPTATCNASTNLNNVYLQTDAASGAWHWMCAYNSVASAYGWVQLFSPIGVATTGKLTAGTLAAGACQAVTATVTGAVAGTNVAAAEPLGLETATAASAAILGVKAYVLSANTVTVYVCNTSGITSATLVAVAYKVRVW